MLTTTFHNALAINIFLAIVSKAPEFDTLLTTTKITHVWYRNNEPRSPVLPVVSIIILCFPSTALLIPHVGSFFIAFALAFVTFLTALLGSISLYRLSPLHPLAKYPGPTLCKLTKIWMAWISLGGRTHIYYKKLHDEYGPIVRIGEGILISLIENVFNWLYVLGPNELSIVNVELISHIYGPQGLPKGPSTINLHINTIFAYLIPFTSVGRETPNPIEQRSIKLQFNRRQRFASAWSTSQAMEQCLPVCCSLGLRGHAEGSCCPIYDTSPKHMRERRLCRFGEPD